ncbi:MAG: FAD-dependent oxidoreductase [Oscillospiraceae bacterium]
MSEAEMESIWHAETELPRFPKLKKDTETDVLIIGGGLAGILTAHFLEQKRVNCVLVEKGRIFGGTSGNTTAKITFQHGLIYHKLLKSRGPEGAKLYLDAQRAAFNGYAELCENIDCDYEVKDNFVYSRNRKKLEKEMDALRRLGYEAEFHEKIPLLVECAGAVMFPGQAQFDPLKFISEIVKDLKIYENTFVREMIGTTAVTDEAKIRAKKVIVATHFPFINKHGSYFLKLYQHRSYVIALENGPKVDGMYVDDDKKGMSFRNYGDFLLLGGGGGRTGKKCGGWSEVRAFAKEHFPAAKEKFFWAAQDCMSLDGVPYIGQYSKRTPDLYVASGFNKWGVTGSMLAAMILSDLVTGRKNEFAGAFSPSRSILKPQLFVNGFEAVTNLLSFSKKRCPHLGCALKWNGAEHSWDCPCHGSRFSESGKLLDGPANGDLE